MRDIGYDLVPRFSLLVRGGGGHDFLSVPLFDPFKQSCFYLHRWFKHAPFIPIDPRIEDP